MNGGKNLHEMSYNSYNHILCHYYIVLRTAEPSYDSSGPVDYSAYHATIGP